MVRARHIDLINNITHRHSLFYAHLAMVRARHIDLINNITHRHSLFYAHLAMVRARHIDLINNITHRHSLFYAHLAMVRARHIDLINNITHRHSLFYAHLAMVRARHIDLINRVYRTHSLGSPAGHDGEWDEMRQDAPCSLQVRQENKINNTLLVNFLRSRWFVFSGFDGVDSSDGFPTLSPRPSSPQKKISNISLGSVSDLFGPESPTRPGPPRSRASALSMISTESAFSVVSCCFVWH